MRWRGCEVIDGFATESHAEDIQSERRGVRID